MSAPTMEQARDAWRRAIAFAVSNGSTNPLVYEWHAEIERERSRKRRSEMTIEERREEWRRHQRARRARKAVA